MVGQYRLNHLGHVEMVEPQHLASGGSVAAGALGGAASGAALGTAIFPGIGTVVGGIGGALIGGLGASGGSSTPPAAQANLVDPSTGLQANVGADGQQQQQFVNALSAQNGIQNQSNVYNQLGGVASGTGPNPAQAMLNQQTGANVSNQAALMAGQRGASSNAGLIARQAAQQGAQTQQQAVGQGATLQAQQSLAALNSQAGIAGQQVGQQQTALSQQQNANLVNQGQVLGSIGSYNSSLTGSQGSVNSANAGINSANNNFQNNLVGGALNAAGGVATTLARGSSSPVSPTSSGSAAGYGSSTTSSNPNSIVGDYSSLAHGGVVPSKTLPSHLNDVAAIYHGDHQFQSLYKGGMAAQGGPVPGTAKVAGDSLKNDTVKTMLSPGEVVIPKSVMESDDPVKGAADFVAALQKKNSGHDNDFKQALAKAVKNRKSS